MSAGTPGGRRRHRLTFTTPGNGQPERAWYVRRGPRGLTRAEQLSDRHASWRASNRANPAGR